MTVFKSKISITSSEFKKNYLFQESIVKEFHEKSLQQKERSLDALKKLHAKNKYTARERIDLLVDPGCAQLEIGLFAAFNMYEDAIFSAGLIAVIGKVCGRECVIVANDPTVKGGTYYPMTVKKHLRAQEIALQNNLPCIYLVDSGGAFLPLQAEVFPDKDHFGKIFYHQARMSAQGIPQLAAVMGSCTAGGAYIPSMCDQSIIVKGNGTIFLAGPPLVKAATGEEVTAEELGGARVHTQLSGVADYFAENEDQAIEMLRDICAHLPLQKKALSFQEFIPPIYSGDEILGVLPAESKVGFDVREIIARIVDASDFHEFKENYGPTLVCGFAKIMGMEIGIIANNGILFSESALKGAHFVELCCQRQIPIIFLQNITGFMVGKKFEQEGIAKNGAKLVTAVSCANVPKITVIIGGSFGAGNYGMCGRAFNPRFLWMWPNAKISVMGGEQAAEVLWMVKNKTETDDEKKFKQNMIAKYSNEGNAYYSSARLWDDGIIDPRDTRTILALSLAACAQAHIEPTTFGVFRM